MSSPFEIITLEGAGRTIDLRGFCSVSACDIPTGESSSAFSSRRMRSVTCPNLRKARRTAIEG